LVFAHAIPALRSGLRWRARQARASAIASGFASCSTLQNIENSLIRPYRSASEGFSARAGPKRGAQHPARNSREHPARNSRERESLMRTSISKTFI